MTPRRHAPTSRRREPDLIIHIAALAAALALAALAAAPGSGAAPTPCATRVTAGGASWSISTTGGFPCASASRILSRLVPRTAPLPVGRYRGTYSGLVCVGRVPGAKPRLLICGNRGQGRGFTAARLGR